MPKKNNPVNRIRFIFGIFALLGFLLLVRLFYIQVIHGEEYQELASHQYVAPKENSFDRGTIFFKDKDGQLFSGAARMTGYTLAISPKTLQDVNKTYEALLKVYPTLSKEVFFAKASKKDDPYEEVAKRLTIEEKDKINSLGLKGVSLYPEYFRFYPYKNFASQVLGFVGFNGNTLSGQYGLERYYNDVLSRDEGGLYVNFFAEIFSDLSKTLFVNDKEREGDLVLTIDPNVQLFAHQVLDDVKKAYNSETLGIIIMDPNDGRILAMEGAPSFDPNNKKGDIKDFANPLVENVYEMGSVIKPLTLAAGIDSGAITPSSTYLDTGSIVINGRTVRDHDHIAHGITTMQDVLGNSLNLGTVYTAQKMGAEQFKKYMLSYGLGEETGIDLPNEAAPLASNLKSDIPVDYLTTSFGQGMAISPIQTIRALATLGNGGKLVNPHIVDSIAYKAFSKEMVPNDAVQVLKPETSEKITRMLVTVVDKSLKSGIYKLPQYTVAAKTGTAQIAMPHGGYYDDRYLHSFFGYFPAYKPRFIVFIFQTHPKGVAFAADSLSEPFFKVAKFLLHYYDVPPDRIDTSLDTSSLKK